MIGNVGDAVYVKSTLAAAFVLAASGRATGASPL